MKNRSYGFVTSGMFQIVFRSKRLSRRIYESYSSFYSAYHSFRYLCKYLQPYYIELFYIDLSGISTSIVLRVFSVNNYQLLLWYRGYSNHKWWFDYE